MKVGVIGLGAMGAPMARRLLDAGHEVGVWARRPETAAPVIAYGATGHATPAALAAASEVVITIVTAGADVEAVAFGADGLFSGFAPGGVLVDMSTIGPSTARRIAARLATRGIAMLDAPVSGGAVGAAAGTLAIMAGGEAEVVERVRPLFEVLGRTVVHVGGNGAGQVAKLCNQLVMVATIEACAEAMRLTGEAGVRGDDVLAALTAGSASSRVLEVFGGRMARRDFAAGVEARLHHKDFAILLDEARAQGVALPLGGVVAQQLNALMALGFGYDDTSSLWRILEIPTGIDQPSVG